MQRTALKFIAMLLLPVLAGCAAGDYNHYTSPEVTGRVLAADTRQPIASVRVRRAASGNDFEPFGPPKGGELLMRPAPALTDADGRFVLGSTSVLALFRNPGWQTVPVSFQHAGYVTLHASYSAGNLVSNTAAGPPVVAAGEVLLQPAGN